MRLLIGICAVFGAILVLGSISLVIKNNRLQAQLSQRGGRTNSHNGKTKGKNIRHDQNDDSDDDFLSNLVDISNSNDEGEDSMDGILDEDSDSNNKMMIVHGLKMILIQKIRTTATNQGVGEEELEMVGVLGKLAQILLTKK